MFTVGRADFSGDSFYKGHCKSTGKMLNVRTYNIYDFLPEESDSKAMTRRTRIIVMIAFAM